MKSSSNPFSRSFEPSPQGVETAVEVPPCLTGTETLGDGLLTLKEHVAIFGEAWPQMAVFTDALVAVINKVRANPANYQCFEVAEIDRPLAGRELREYLVANAGARDLKRPFAASGKPPASAAPATATPAPAATSAFAGAFGSAGLFGEGG